MAAAIRNSDVIHIHGLWSLWLWGIYRMAHHMHKPVILSPHGMAMHWSLGQKSWKKSLAMLAFQKTMLRHVQKILVTSHQECQELPAWINRDRVIEVPLGVEAPQYDRPPEPCGNHHIALFLSRLHPKKGLPFLLRSWASIRPPNWQLVVAGGDESGHGQLIGHMIKDLDLAGCCRLIGPVHGDEKWSLYRSAELFVLPTQSENFGIVIGEAMCAGLPVITTTGAPWQCLTTHQAGWWINPTQEALDHALRQAFALSVAQRHDMGCRALAYAHNNLRWPIIAKRMESVYERTIRGNLAT